MNNNVIFYGAGKNMRDLLEFFDACGIPFDCPIWDRNADVIKSIRGHKVHFPEYVESKGRKVFITISDFSTRNQISEHLSTFGMEILPSFNVIKSSPPNDSPDIRYPLDFTDFDKEIVRKVISEELSIVTLQHYFTIVLACKHIIKNNIEGDWVECGVWRGGASLLAASIFKHYGANRKVYLYDTFEGFDDVKPEEMDDEATVDYLNNKKYNCLFNSTYCGNSIEDVQANFERYGLLDKNVVFVKGKVEDTLAVEQNLPEKIAVFRNDTDFYSSTKMQMHVLYPRLSVGGVYINDDYDYFEGSRVATDEYFETTKTPKPFLQVVDTGRMGIKL